MAEAEDHRPLQSKRKAISALLPYAVWRERDGQPEMFNTILDAARASRPVLSMWHHTNQFVSTLLSEASLRAIVLVSPHIPWYHLTGRGDLVRWWAATVSEAPYTEEVVRSMVATLSQITHQDKLVPYIPIDIWLWLTRRPSSQLISWRHYLGTSGFVVKAVQALKDIEVLKSYLILVWSEWDSLTSNGFDEMCTLIGEDFGEIGMGHHRADLIQRLDHVLGQLDRGLEHLKQHNSEFDEDGLRRAKDQYRRLRDTLLKTNIEAIARTCYPVITLLSILTQVDIHRIPRNVCVRASSTMSIDSRLEPTTLFIRPYRFLCTRSSISVPTRRTPHPAFFLPH